MTPGLEKLKEQLDIDSFFSSFSEILADKLNEYLINKTANLLILHYAMQKIENKMQYSEQEFLKVTTKRIIAYLAGAKLESEDFGDALTLLAVAISENPLFIEDEKSQNIALDDIIAENIAQQLDLPIPHDQAKKILVTLLSKAKKLLTQLLEKDIAKMKGLIMDHYAQDPVNAAVNLANSLQQQQDLSIQNRKSLASIFSVLAIAGVAAIGSIFLGALAPVIILPIIFVGADLGAKTSDIVNDKISLAVAAKSETKSFVNHMIERINNRQQDTASIVSKVEISQEIIAEAKLNIKDVAINLASKNLGINHLDEFQKKVERFIEKP